MDGKLFAFMVMELGWKALLVYMIHLWGSPFAGQDLMTVVVVTSGIVQLTYLLSYKRPGPVQKKEVKPKKQAAPKVVVQKESK